jgi:hypothetical protein
MATISLYNHTRSRFASGANAATDTYRVILCTAATFNAADTTLAGITYTEVTNANGYTTNGQALTSVAVSIVSTSNARFDADDVSWSATGAGISASRGLLVNATDANSPPVAFIDLEGTQTAAAGTNFLIRWNAGGIISFT